MVFGIQFLNGLIQVKQDTALGIVTHQALQPEKRSNARAACHCRDFMQAGGGIQDHVSGGQFNALCTIGILNNQLTTVIFIRVGKKQSG